MNEPEEPVRELQVEVVAASAIESIERASVDIQITTAHKYPRSLAIVKRRMMELATLDEETAESCFYKLNRQGKNIEGPSIRLAEIAASSFGNIRFGARVVSRDAKEITAQGFCHDLESNVLSTIEVKRRIVGRDGRTYSDDMVVVTGNAACAIAARNAIFKVVPFAFVKPIFEAAKKAAVGDIKTLAERRTKMLARFAALGVNEKKICASLGRKGVEEIGLEDLETLIGVHSAVKDGEQTIEEAFPEQKAPIDFNAPAQEAVQKHEDRKPLKKPKPKQESEADSAAPALAKPIEGLRNLIGATPGIEESHVMVFLFSQQRCEQGQKLDDLSEETIQDVIENWLPIVDQIKA